MIPAIMPTYGRAEMTFEKGMGSWLIERDGTRYLDFGGGIAVTALGHAHPDLVKVVQEQAASLWHTSNLYNIPAQQALADKLVAETFADTCFFTNSGAEAMECALKTARKYWSSNRTGKLFAHEWAGITPDIMAVAKGIGNGFPLGACLATEEAARGMTAGTHGSTYGGNPMACAVGGAVMDHIADDAFLADVNRKAGLMRQKLEGLVASHPDVFELVRGAGLMIGVKCKVPNMDVINAGYAEQILTIPGGDNVIRVLPALNISDDEIAEGVARLDRVAIRVEASL